MPAILLVEDEAALAMTLTDRLRFSGYDVDHAANGAEALRLASEKPYDLVMLDVMMPGANGFEVLRDMRKGGMSAPVLMLTARGELADKLTGFQSGADDYVTKPFETLELLARVEALIRRGAASRQPMGVVQFGPVEVDLRTGEVRKDGQVIEMAARELQLLRYLLERRGQTISREELLKEVWGYDSSLLTRTVDVHVAWLRQKIEQNPHSPRYLITLRGQGYRLAD
ncbi:MAG: response regulator transcription factor [Bryobacteraceae bacterium]|nr:response regulator transcription factor [Bryobacteraceae bacterium]